MHIYQIPHKIIVLRRDEGDAMPVINPRKKILNTDAEDIKALMLDLSSIEAGYILPSLDVYVLNKHGRIMTKSKIVKDGKLTPINIRVRMKLRKTHDTSMSHKGDGVPYNGPDIFSGEVRVYVYM